MLPITYGAAKARFAAVYNDGTGTTNPNLLPAVNEAIEAIMMEVASVNPRGIYVGGVDRIALPITSDVSGGIFTLPPAYEVALNVELPSTNDINNGWYSDLDMAGLVDPDYAFDVGMVPQGLNTSGNRVYTVPTAVVGDTAQVVAKKRFLAVTQDSDFLPVPNVLAIKDMMIALRKRQARDNFADSENYRQSALRVLKEELDGYLLDPTRTLFRKQAYMADERTYAVGTLGYVRARIALDVPGALKIGKSQITRAINRAVERLIQRRNEIRTTGRLSVKTGVANVTFSQVLLPTSVLQIGDYEQIRTMVMSFLPNEGAAGDYEARAYALLEGQETNALETLRHTTYATNLQGFISTNHKTQLGYFTNKLQLESPDGLRISDVEMRRMVNEAAREAVQRRNELGANDHYSNLNGPELLTFAYAQADTDELSYTDFEVIRLLVMAQQHPAEPAYRQQAQERIEANLYTAAVSWRNQLWNCLLALPYYTFGRTRAQVGLGLAEQGFHYSDAKIGRMVNDAEDMLSRTPNFARGEGEYMLTVQDGMVELPADAERIIYADVCGFPLETKHRSFDYLGYPNGRNVAGSQADAYPGWGFLSPWGWRGNAALQDKGYTAAGRRQYYVDACPSDGAVRVIVKRRWLPKVDDSDVMLIQNTGAIRLMVESQIARLAKDLNSAAALSGAAASAMDQDLANQNGSETMVPKFKTLTGTRGGMRQLARR